MTLDTDLVLGYVANPRMRSPTTPQNNGCVFLKARVQWLEREIVRLRGLSRPPRPTTTTTTTTTEPPPLIFEELQTKTTAPEFRDKPEIRLIHVYDLLKNYIRNIEAKPDELDEVY